MATGTKFYYLSPVGRKGLDDYKYVSGSSTFLDRLMNKFWEFSITLVPLWIAPNMITLLGLSVNIFGCALMLWYSPKLDTPVPGWVNIVCGVTLFLYQTLDAIDGKQARRTKSSSALGQLFDHGCDAMSTFIGALSLCVCLQTGPQQGLTFVTIACMAFFIAQWNEYYTHVLSTNVAGVFGVTEAQLMIVAIHIGTALLDQSFWGVPASSFWQTREVIEPISCFGSTFTFRYTDCFCYFTVFVAVAKYVSEAIKANARFDE
eukprot:INCI7200.4.p1 GENE.INCI7200.4~~INCI7200.4.p1  ORF type:complete len:261 (-),score=39.97 INCI7200.4:608-1390(-)